MNPLDQELNTLIEQARQHPPGMLRRRLILNRVVSKIQQSGRLHRTYEPFYLEAESRMWLYFMQNVCEATTANSAYDPALVHDGSVITWLNNHLKYRLQDERQRQRTEQQRRVLPRSNDESGETIDPVDNIPSNIGNEITEPNLIVAIRQWAEADVDQTLCQCHIRHKPNASCKYLILKRLPPETAWEVLSNELATSIPTLSTHFQRRCIKFLQDFCRDQGFHD